MNRTNTKTCDACGEQLVFLKSERTGKSMPINATTVEAGDEYFEHGRHVSHFSNCPEAARFRRERKSK